MTPPEAAKKAKALLKKASLRQTAPRQAVLQALICADNPITQERITDFLSDEAPNKVTIYRVLECLIEKGIVHNAFTKDRTAFFELAHNCGKVQCHPHFTCNNCQRTICMTNVTMPIAEIAEKGFSLLHQKVELEGICPQCSNLS